MEQNKICDGVRNIVNFIAEHFDVWYRPIVLDVNCTLFCFREMRSRVCPISWQRQ